MHPLHAICTQSNPEFAVSSGVIFLDMGSIAESRLAGFPGMLGKRCKIVVTKYHQVEVLYDTCCEAMHCVTDCGSFHVGLSKQCTNLSLGNCLAGVVYHIIIAGTTSMFSAVTLSLPGWPTNTVPYNHRRHDYSMFSAVTLSLPGWPTI